MQEHPGLKLGIGQKVKQDGRNLGVSGRKMRKKMVEALYGGEWPERERGGISP